MVVVSGQCKKQKNFLSTRVFALSTHKQYSKHLFMICVSIILNPPNGNNRLRELTFSTVLT